MNVSVAELEKNYGFVLFFCIDKCFVVWRDT